jgi:hypothetical protein
MKTTDPDDHSPIRASQRRARIERLLFAGATLATTALTLGMLADPKIPPFKGE